MSSALPEPQSRLFLTCDLVGSTRFKERNEKWITAFLDFYSEFPAAFGRALRKFGDAKDLEPQLWKAVGDELIFEVAVTSEADVIVSISAWLAAMSEYDDTRRKKGAITRETDTGPKGDTGKHRSDRAPEGNGEENSDYLLAQGSAFLAVTPWPNRKVGARLRPTDDAGRSPFGAYVPEEAGIVESSKAVEANDLSEYFYDYLGPSFDTGFRVSTLRSPRHFTLSLEVAWIIAQARTLKQSMDLALTWLGSHDLKGVWGSRPYPVYAVDRGRQPSGSDPASVGHAYDDALWAVHGVDDRGCAHIIALGEAASLQRETPVNIYLESAAHAPFRQRRVELEAAVLEENQSRELYVETSGAVVGLALDDPEAMV
ncbi:hypothetical protein [Curtobacterium flaccumfaciens]|uniref:hypothetical protein n=1 Tax=Curtobacterium flaccumfaciens TaxID=2035 RepID=UPI001ADA20AD|nr:hypothetical protein [Curtobacterium flaccumfaciens]MBO9049533.1 hypothetical protein [Curtobacterium flaccumfaciens pv. flaccumfaciens]